MVTKTITIKKRGGGTRKQKVQVLRSGKFKFIKNSARSVSRKTKRAVRKTARKTRAKVKRRVTRRRTMVKRRSSSRSRGFLGSSKIKTIGKQVAIGAGTGAAVGLVARAVGQPNLGANPLIAAAGAFFLGGPIAGGVALLLNGGLGALTGGGNGGGSTEGFA